MKESAFFWSTSSKLPRLGDVQIVHIFKPPIESHMVSKDQYMVWVGTWIYIPELLVNILINMSFKWRK